MNIPFENSKENFKIREEIISQVYSRWIEENPDKRVYNRSLKDYINIRYLSITETRRHAAKSYTSTLALLQLDTILRYAIKVGKPKPTKRGSKNQNNTNDNIPTIIITTTAIQPILPEFPLSESGTIVPSSFSPKKSSEAPG